MQPQENSRSKDRRNSDGPNQIHSEALNVSLWRDSGTTSAPEKNSDKRDSDSAWITQPIRDLVNVSPLYNKAREYASKMTDAVGRPYQLRIDRNPLRTAQEKPTNAEMHGFKQFRTTDLYGRFRFGGMLVSNWKWSHKYLIVQK